MLRLLGTALLCATFLVACATTTPPETPELVPSAAFDPASLPADADRSNSEAQRALWSRGLYRTQDGQTRALPPDWKEVRFSAPAVEEPEQERALPQDDERIEIILEETSD